MRKDAIGFEEYHRWVPDGMGRQCSCACLPACLPCRMEVLPAPPPPLRLKLGVGCRPRPGLASFVAGPSSRPDVQPVPYLATAKPTLFSKRVAAHILKRRYCYQQSIGTQVRNDSHHFKDLSTRSTYLPSTAQFHRDPIPPPPVLSLRVTRSFRLPAALHICPLVSFSLTSSQHSFARVSATFSVGASMSCRHRTAASVIALSRDQPLKAFTLSSRRAAARTARSWATWTTVHQRHCWLFLISLQVEVLLHSVSTTAEPSGGLTRRERVSLGLGKLMFAEIYFVFSYLHSQHTVSL